MKGYLLTAAVVVITTTPSQAGQFTPSIPYREIADSPFHEFGIEGALVIEDFEDGALNIPGVQQIRDDSGQLGVNFIGPGYSVVADVSAGSTGRSLQAMPSFCTATYPEQCAARVSFEFTQEAFGTLPTYVGFAWTDAVRGHETHIHPLAAVSVHDATGQVSTAVVDNLPLAETMPTSHADDIFIGHMNPEGISRLDVTVITTFEGSGHLSLDHLQIGVASLPGDADRDGDVDFVDFARFSQSYPTSTGASWETGDFNLDTHVTFPDFLLLSDNFGGQVSAAVANVPEPAASLWGCCMWLVAGVCRRVGGRKRLP